MPTASELLSSGLQLHQAGNIQQAEHCYRSVLEVEPEHADAHHLLGVIFFQTGRLEGAVASIRHALALNPAAAIYHSNLGLAYQSLGQLDLAKKCFEEALRCHPDFPEAHNNLSLLLIQDNAIGEAMAHLREALRLRPHYGEAHNNLGNALQRLGKNDEAIASHREALRLNPSYAEAYNNLGVALQQQGKLNDAVAHCRQALRLRPRYAEAYNNLGMALRLGGHWDESLACFDEALRIDPGYPGANWNRALMQLVHGDFAQGLPAYEWRWMQPGSTRRSFTHPLWDGLALEGRTILLYSEQGLGDTLQFIRYAKLVKQRGGKCIVECQPVLWPILKGVPGIDQLVSRSSLPPDFDVQAPLLSLPGIFGTKLDTIPATVPYLAADSHLVEKWRRELAGLPGFKVGIAWQGNPGFLHDHFRSIPPKHFSRLAKVQGVSLISLQKGASSCELSAISYQPKGLDETAGAFMDTAAIMKNVDLVISSDTAIPHVAGALGVEVWLAVPLAPDWRWQLKRDDSPWYPTMRLLRQAQVGDWAEVFERIADQLQSRISHRADCI